MNITTRVTKRYESAEDISAIDLREEARRAEASGSPWQGWRMLINGQAADLLDLEGRVGIAWGGDAVWGDAISNEDVSDTVRRLFGEGE